MIEKALKELAIQDPEYVSDLLKKIEEELKMAKRKRLEEIVKENFEKYEEVFSTGVMVVCQSDLEECKAWFMKNTVTV